MNYTALPPNVVNSTASLKISYQDLRRAFARLHDPRGGLRPNKYAFSRHRCALVKSFRGVSHCGVVRGSGRGS